MRRLSSNFTLFLKIFIPIGYIVFFGSFLIGSFLISSNDSPLLGNSIFRLIFATIFLLFVVILYFTFIKLKRVDADKTSIYINNYYKTYRYSWNDVKKVTYRNYGLFKTMRVHFKAKTKVGNKISFLPSIPLIEDFMIEFPELYPLLSQE